VRGVLAGSSTGVAAAQAYASAANAANSPRLSAATEPPRQELFRRLNRAPGGTATILRMRERLLQAKRDQPELDAVDADLRHLLSSWFNPGFLQIVRVDWRTPAYLLEQIIAHEAVHEIQGWGDLRRRLDANGATRLFPSGAAGRAADLRRGRADRPDGRDGRAAARGTGSLGQSRPGHHRRVLLDQQLPAGTQGGLARQLPDQAGRRRAVAGAPEAQGLLHALTDPGVAAAPGLADPLRPSSAAAPHGRAARRSPEPRRRGPRPSPRSEPLLALCAAFLLRGGERDDAARDPVSRFHLNNGARLERINWLADRSKKGLRESLGLMANYLYLPRQIASHHEKFMRGEVVASHRVRALAPGRGRAVRDS
jgi:malonyl-CoA decarboxylase